MQPNRRAADRSDRRVSDRRGGDNRLDRIQAAQDNLKCATVAHEYKLDVLLERLQKAMTVIYQLRIASDGAKIDSRRREKAVEDINHRLAVIEKRLQGVREQRRVS